MDIFAKNRQAADPVEWFAEQIMRHPERADVLKDSFRRQIGAAPPDSAASDPNDPEDLWDNVPV